jgi:hypothetical protein
LRNQRLVVAKLVPAASRQRLTKAGGFHRLAHQALFFGEVISGQFYFVVDDFVGQGGTLANLIGFIHSRGGSVLGATVLNGKPYSVKLATSNKPRMLKPFEIELLQQDLKAALSIEGHARAKVTATGTLT